MHIVQFLITVASQHNQEKDRHERELHNLQQKRKKKGDISKLTYRDEIALLNGVIDSVTSTPACLKKLSSQAIGALAYIVRAKISNDAHLEVHDIIDKLMCDAEKMTEYLECIDELKKAKWIWLIEIKKTAFTDQPPFSWLPFLIELGDSFHKAMGQHKTLVFTSNDAYLDTLYQYLQTVIDERNGLYQISEPDTDLAAVQLEGWYRTIEVRLNASTCALPAAEVRQKYSLSIFQYLAIIGLMGMRDKDVKYDFSDPYDVVRLFASGRVCRIHMKEHIFGAKSPLLLRRLIEGTNSSFGETVRLTQTGITALVGRGGGKKSTQDLKSHVKKSTLFDFEEPKVKSTTLMLPPPVMETLQSLLFSESRKGRQLRKNWQSLLPSSWGAPTGSTVLLFGPPGTGKTLTAQYIASQLKLPLLKIDASQILSCWVGESEQNVRRIFDDYASLHKEIGKAPVLLLNEADQLLGVRGAGQSGTDRMNNNMQNLFLEGLERFDGIMIATTNRRDLLDEAFSRRFTYKLELPPPDRTLRAELWKSHLPMKRLAADVEIAHLADLGLTGGEIRLVVERAVRLLAYRGSTTIDNKTLSDIAREELACRMKRSGMNRIGFGAGNT